ncbi:MAG: TetR/AcrR family transcriptional regulator [Bacillota bacterium]|nr:TetR/AcrR family transcriptional regulator [Bacillota bacterium]MDD4707351.1 TetR/AcrR family transcriptional regulator [Bacillota bacterium]
MIGVGKREQILAAAAEIFSKEGYHNARVEDIAIKAGIGKGTVYEYFKSKKELFEETIFHVLETYLYEALESISGVQDPVDKLKCIIRLQASLLDRKGNIATLFMKNSADIHREMLDRLIAFRQRVIDFIADIIREGIEGGAFRPVDPHLAGILFMGVLQEAGTIHHSGSRINDQTLDTMLDYMINGIGIN